MACILQTVTGVAYVMHRLRWRKILISDLRALFR